MDASLEIRKLSPSYTRELVQILENHDLWKRLMCIIPKRLEKNNYTCDVTLENQHKYNTEHFKLIENASEKYRRACTEILFDEWGTSGRIRPTLGHLLYLLTKAKLFRAADYVAENLLKQEKPKRPISGPEALIPIVLPETPAHTNRKSAEIEELLDRIDYPSSAVLVIRSNSEVVRNNVRVVIPQIVISPNVDEDTNYSNFKSPVVMQREKMSESDNTTTKSDMIIFSETQVQKTLDHNSTTASDMITFSENAVCNEKLGSIDSIDISASNMPQISSLLNNQQESNLPDFDMMNNSLTISSVNGSYSTDSSDISESSSNPAFSQLLNSSNSSNNISPVPNSADNKTTSCEFNMPNLSALNNSVCIDDTQNTGISEACSSAIPDFNALQNSSEQIPVVNISEVKQSSSDFIPDFGALKSNEHIESTSVLNPRPNCSSLLPSKSLSVNVSMHSSDNSTKSRPCTSPLPNLSLNTLLPHFIYSELEVATNNFNDNLYTDLHNSGRFLGSGAFGSVFLAPDLLDRPVAVKKLILEDVEVVNIDDIVTKQFRNEVEVLSKYKHRNLLSLLGYSCDGYTYCLLYEYIPGGALRNRLQVTENKLHWKERLNIAVGTARAVSYLHTAFETPLIHRDIKSANILLDSKNRPKLCDFGLIKLSPNQNTNTATTVFGTSAYMAPEAFRGDISVKLDTFSFGVVILELLTSLPPMDESRDGTDLVTHVEDKCESNNIKPLLDTEIGSWQQDEVNYAEEFFNVALRCLEEKRKRPNMVEVSELLDRLLDKLI